MEVACKRLSGFVVEKARGVANELGVVWESRHQSLCPGSGKQIKAAFERCLKTGEQYPVYGGGCETSLYGREGNLAFRFWHDFLHWKNGLTIKLEDEVLLGELHRKEVDEEFGEGSLEGRLVYADVVEQIRYYYRTGRFVTDQKNSSRRS